MTEPVKPSETESADSPEPAEPTRRRRSELRRLLARFALIAGLGLAIIAFMSYWQDRSLTVDLVHSVAGGDILLPADVEVQVWEGDTLHADAFFPQPESLTELTHSLKVPAGEYRVTLAVIRVYGRDELRFEREVSISGEWETYHLAYELDPPSALQVPASTVPAHEQ